MFQKRHLQHRCISSGTNNTAVYTLLGFSKLVWKNLARVARDRWQNPLVLRGIFSEVCGQKSSEGLRERRERRMTTFLKLQATGNRVAGVQRPFGDCRPLERHRIALPLPHAISASPERKPQRVLRTRAGNLSAVRTAAQRFFFA